MKTFVIRISSNEDSVKSTEQVKKSARDVGYPEEIVDWDATLPHEWKSILPYSNNNFDKYARPDNVGACFASHFLLWKECIKLNEPILILEHDAIFKTNIPDIDFNMCVNFGRPSYIRPGHMIYVEQKDGLQRLNQVNFLGHHGYALKPKAAKKFCDDVETRTLTPNDVWISKDIYPWLEEYRPYPIHADTDFSTIQWPENDQLLKNYLKWREKDSEKYKYLQKYFPHVISDPQSKRYIDV